MRHYTDILPINQCCKPVKYDPIEMPADAITLKQAWRCVLAEMIDYQQSIDLTRSPRIRLRPLKRANREAGLRVLHHWIDLHSRGNITPLRPAEYFLKETRESRLTQHRLTLRINGKNTAKPQRSTIPAVMREAIYRPPGMLADIIDWITETSPCVQPELAFANAVAFMGALLGRRVQTQSGLRTNVYLIGVSPSGSGKDHSRGAIKNLAAAAGVQHLLGGEDVTSDAAILSATHRQPSILFQIDEVGHFINSALNTRAAAYTKTIPQTLTKLFTSASNIYLGKEYAGLREREDIRQPNVCMYGTTVPGRLWEGITPSEIVDGFIPRILIVNGRHDPDEQDSTPQPPPESLIQRVKAWTQFPDGNLAPHHSSQLDPVVTTVPFDRAAWSQFDTARRRWKKFSQSGDDATGALWKRASEHAAKLALIYACSRTANPDCIDGVDATHAILLVEHLLFDVIEQIGDHVSSSEYGRETQKLYRVIKERGPIGLTELSLATRGMQLRLRRDALTDLQQQGRISEYAIDTGGRPRIMYRATGN